MRTVTLQLPDSLLDRIKELADREGISLDQFLATAAAEKLATEAYMELRASRGSREKLQRILDRVPHGPPDPGDELE